MDKLLALLAGGNLTERIQSLIDGQLDGIEGLEKMVEWVKYVPNNGPLPEGTTHWNATTSVATGGDMKIAFKVVDEYKGLVDIALGIV